MCPGGTHARCPGLKCVSWPSWGGGGGNHARHPGLKCVSWEGGGPCPPSMVKVCVLGGAMPAVWGTLGVKVCVLGEPCPPSRVL